MKVPEVELWIDILERPHTARALLILYRYGTLHQSDLSDMLSPGSNVPPRRIEGLIRAGLIVETIAPESGRYLMLTEIGQHVGKHLDEIERFISPDDGEIEMVPMELYVR
jgi:hypothetical protein